MDKKNTVNELGKAERKELWRRARKFSTMSADEVADLLGKRAVTIRTFDCRSGTAATVQDIKRLRDHNLRRAVDFLRQEYGEDVIVGA